jgi:transposase
MKKGSKMKKYRVHSAEFKQSVINEVETGKSQSQVARENGISVGLVSKWLQLAGAGQCFEDRPTAREKELEKQLERAERKIGQQAIALDLLKKLHQEASQRTKRSSGLIATGKRLPARKGEPQK